VSTNKHNFFFFFSLFFLLNTSWHLLADEKKEIIFSKGVTDTYQSEAIAFGLFDEISSQFKYFVQDSHFIYGSKKLNFQVEFNTAYVDLNLDGQNEVLVEVVTSGLCGSSGCTTYLLEKRMKENIDLNQTNGSWEWIKIGEFFGFRFDTVSSKENYGYLSMVGLSEFYNYECYYQNNLDKYECKTNKK
jgi:hypothetical protein